MVQPADWRDMKSKPIITEFMEYCIICGKPAEWHHCFSGTANRSISDADGLVIPLCTDHHNSSRMSAHQNKEMYTLIHIIGQLAWEKHYIYVNECSESQARSDFMNRYGKSYI